MALTLTTPTITARPLTTDEAHTIRVATLRALQDQPYLASALLAAPAVATPGIGTIAADHRWRLSIDPAIFTAWTVPEQAAQLLHVVNHLVRDHHTRATAIGADHPDLFNTAADAVINDDLTPTGLPLPGTPTTSTTLGIPTGNTVEHVYMLLAAQHEAPSADPDRTGGALTAVGWPSRAPSCGTAAGGTPFPIDGLDAVEAGVGDVRGQLIRRQVATEVSHAVRTQAARGRRTLPAGLARWAELQLAPPTIDWRRMLASEIRNAISWTSGRVDHTYRRPSRRRIPRVILPAMHKPRIRLTTIIDTSGSMGDADLHAAMSEVNGICTRAGLRGEDHTALSVDTHAHTPTRIRRASDLDLTGGGGTDMRIGIAAALTQRPHPDVIVVLTDGWTPWPDTPPKHSRLIIGVIGDHGMAPATPDWAARIDIPTQDRP